MNNLDIHFPELEVSPASFPDLRPARRLMVLVPETRADTAPAAQKIRELANALESRIQFLGLSRDAAHEPGLRRQIINLSAMVADSGQVSIESKIEFGSSWLNAVKSEWQEGDVIVCFDGQYAGLARRPLNQILESNFNATIYVLTGAGQADGSPYLNWFFNTLAWAGSIGIILGFFWIQSMLIQSPTDWAHSALLYISLFIEAGAIWVWNNIFNSLTEK